MQVVSAQTLRKLKPIACKAEGALKVLQEKHRKLLLDASKLQDEHDELKRQKAADDSTSIGKEKQSAALSNKIAAMTAADAEQQAALREKEAALQKREAALQKREAALREKEAALQVCEASRTYERDLSRGEQEGVTETY